MRPRGGGSGGRWVRAECGPVGTQISDVAQKGCSIVIELKQSKKAAGKRASLSTKRQAAWTLNVHTCTFAELHNHGVNNLKRTRTDSVPY